MHTPIRECIGCGKKFPKNELIRVVKKDGQIFFDKTGKSYGRGAYMCKNLKCIECLKHKKLNRAFRQNVSEEVYNKLAEEMGHLFE